MQLRSRRLLTPGLDHSFQSSIFTQRPNKFHKFHRVSNFQLHPCPYRIRCMDLKGLKGQNVLSIHRFFATSSVARFCEQRNPHPPLPAHFLQLFWCDPKVFPGQPGDLASPLSWVFPLGPLPMGHAQNTTRLAPLNVDEQQLFSKLLTLSLKMRPATRRKLIFCVL